MMKLNDEYLALTARLTHDIKTASYALLGLGTGARHLEIGSGNGHDSIALAELYPDAHITGIDLNPDIVTVANRRVKEKGLRNIEHLTGDATATVFAGKFASMRAERVFQHLQDEQIHALVRHMAGYAGPRCVFLVVGVDWETLTCTVAKKHRETFRLIKQFLIDVSNITCVHTAITAFENNGFQTGDIDTYCITTGSFKIAMTAFNLENIARELALDSDRFTSMQADFRDGKHYFSVGGSTAPFIYQG